MTYMMDAAEKREWNLRATQLVFAAMDAIVIATGKDFEDDATNRWVADNQAHEAKELNTLRDVLVSLACRVNVHPDILADIYRRRGKSNEVHDTESNS